MTVAWLAALASWAASAPAAADDRVEAEQLFRAAAAAYERGEYRAAALAFEEAYKRSPAPAVLYNEGLAWQAAGDAPRAADAYQVADDPALDEPSRADARARLADLRHRVGWVRIVAPAGAIATIAHANGRRIPTVVHLAPGDYDLRVQSADGRTATERIRSAAGAEQTIRVILFEPGPRGSPMRTAGWIGIGLAATLSIAAVALGVSAAKANEAFDAGGNTDADLRDRAIRLQTWTNVAVVAAAVSAAAGVTLLVLAPRSRSNSRPRLGARGSSMSIGF